MSNSAILTPGSVFAGQFRVVRPLAEGGMGAVYVAEQLSTGKQRALKVMQPMLLGDARSRERFELEATVASKLYSDHIVEVVGAGVDAASGAPWLAMELLSGQTLAELVERQGVRSRDEVADIFRQLCYGLSEAHRAGLVHRDLKPENVFLADARRADVRFTVKILDFGIAKVVQETKSVATTAIGTPLWMAPEQTESGVRVSPRTDVWPLGLIAFYLFTGRYYWRSAGEPDTSLMAILREVLMGPLDAPSSRSAEFGNGNSLPPGFDEWFLRCLSRSPNERFANAAEAMDALAPVLGVAPLSPRPSRPAAKEPSLPATLPLTSPLVLSQSGSTTEPFVAQTLPLARAGSTVMGEQGVTNASPVPSQSKWVPLLALGGVAAAFAVVVVLSSTKASDRLPASPAAASQESVLLPPTASPSPDQLACDKARVAGTADAWREYQSAFATGTCAREAERALAASVKDSEAEACTNARSAGSVEAWNGYLAQYPEGACAPEAKGIVRRNLWLTRSFPCKAISTTSLRTCRIKTASNGTYSLDFAGDAICRDLRFGPDGDPTELKGCAIGPNMTGLSMPAQAKLQVGGSPRTWFGSQGGWRWANGEKYCCPGLWLVDPSYRD
ncbi:MAG TPA: protein kinase [Polyangiaceae bacterium]|nr:protein kinase [Polyangiaceae bacterium]